MKVQLNGKTLRLRWLSDSDYIQAERLAAMSGVPLNVCPTCLTPEALVPEHSEDEPDLDTRIYRFRGDEHFCDCAAQIALRARYLLANIGEQYMRLDWDDYDRSDDVRSSVSAYLSNWESFKINGMGVEFGGKGLGVGKTFGATHVGKEMVKHGQQVYFIHFVDVVSAYQREDSQSFEDKLKSVTYLILDELLPPISDSQHSLFASRLESLIRHRTNFNLPTIITTNLMTEELDKHYPRTYSLLAAKQLRIDMTGVDARRNRIAEENMELVLNGEVRPIT